MADIEEIKEITERNLRAVISAEKQSKKNYDKGYYLGKSDALEHILELIKEGN